MIYLLMAVLALSILSSAAAIYFFGWIGALVVAVAILSLPWTAGLIGSFFIRLFVREMLGDMAKPLAGATVVLDSFEPIDAPTFAFDDDYADDMESKFGPRDWFAMELTINTDASILDKEGDQPQWDPELMLPFVPSDSKRIDLNDPTLTLCEVARCEVFADGKWQTKRQAVGSTRVRMHVGVPQDAKRFCFVYCLKTVFGEIALPDRSALVKV